MAVAAQICTQALSRPVQVNVGKKENNQMGESMKLKQLPMIKVLFNSTAKDYTGAHSV